MSKFLTASQIQSFDSEVKHAYQGMGGIRKTVRVKTGVVGNQHKFPTMGKGLATARIPQTDVVPMNISHARLTATLTDWNAPEYTDIFDQQKTNIDERGQLAFTIAGAIGRREDQLILDAWDAASTSLVVDEDFGSTDSSLTTAKFRESKRLLDVGGVPMSERYAMIHANAMYGLLGDSDANTFDKNAVKALVDGDVTRWLGFQVATMEDRDEGGIPLASNIRTNYFYHGGARGGTGLAVGIDFRTEVNYIAEKTSWLANGLFTAGAVQIDAAGLVETQSYEA